MVPVFAENGTLTEVYGRKIRDDLRKGTPKHLYLPEECRGDTRGVWNIEALQASREIILCEALIDAATFWCAGYQYINRSYRRTGTLWDSRYKSSLCRRRPICSRVSVTLS